MQTMRLRSWVLVLAMLLGGCSFAAPSTQYAGGAGDPLKNADLSAVSAAQKEEISDRIATEEEYQAAFQRYRGCLSAAGFELTDLELKNRVYDFSVPGDAVKAGADKKCYDAEFHYTDMLWQTSEVIENNSENAQLFRECLRKHGIEPHDSIKGMSEQLDKAGIKPTECLS